MKHLPVESDESYYQFDETCSPLAQLKPQGVGNIWIKIVLKAGLVVCVFGLGFLLSVFDNRGNKIWLKTINFKSSKKPGHVDQTLETVDSEDDDYASSTEDIKYTRVEIRDLSEEQWYNVRFNPVVKFSYKLLV